jgi:hypothetical protein
MVFAILSLSVLLIWIGIGIQGMPIRILPIQNPGWYLSIESTCVFLLYFQSLCSNSFLAYILYGTVVPLYKNYV